MENTKLYELNHNYNSFFSFYSIGNLIGCRNF